MNKNTPELVYAYKGQLEALHEEIARLQEAKRRALAIADERAKENVALRAILRDARDHVPYDVLARIDAALGLEQRKP